MLLSHVISLALVALAVYSLRGLIKYIDSDPYLRGDDVFLMSFYEIVLLGFVVWGVWTLERPLTEEVTKHVGSVGGVHVVEVERPGEVLPAKTSSNCIIANKGKAAVRVEGFCCGGRYPDWSTVLKPGESKTTSYKACDVLRVYSKRGGYLGLIH